MPGNIHDLADALGQAINLRDADRLETLYADEITIWHGAFGNTQGKAENIGLLSAAFQLTSRLEYLNVHRYDIPGGVVQQHQLAATLSDGLELPALNVCMIIKGDNNQITRIEEYFDARTFDELWTRIAALTPA